MGKIDYGPDEEFIANYEKLKSAKKMGILYKVSGTSILHHAKKIGYDVNSNKTYKLSPEDKKDIINSYNKKTSSELANQYHVSRGMITKIWYDANLSGKEKSRRYQIENQDFFHCIDTEEKAYFLGFIAADGCVYEPKDSRQTIIRICLAEKDIEILEKFQQAIQTNKPIYTEIRDDSHRYVSLEICSDQMGDDLIKLGIMPRKTYLKTWVPLTSPQLQNAFIRGYFDGDGTISTNFTIHTLHSVNIGISGFRDNLQFFIDYLASQGISSKFQLDHRIDKYTQENFGELVFTNKSSKIKFLNLIYPDNSIIYLSRKFALATSFKELCKLQPKTWTLK